MVLCVEVSLADKTIDGRRSIVGRPIVELDTWVNDSIYAIAESRDLDWKQVGRVLSCIFLEVLLGNDVRVMMRNKVAQIIDHTSHGDISVGFAFTVER
jgi:hypothetical protein